MNVATQMVGEILHFAQPPQNPLEVVGLRSDGQAPLLLPEHGALFHGSGRVAWGLTRMAVRAPGNEGSLLMVVPRSIPEWMRLATTNRSGRLPPDWEFNPDGEKAVHILPPRNAVAALGQLRTDASRLSQIRGAETDAQQLLGIAQWGDQQLQDPRVAGATDYWLRAARFQAITTNVSDLPGVVDSSLVRSLHPQGLYTFFHPTKSMTHPQQEGGRPLLGHELLQALLEQGGRSDLTGRVVASAGFWLEGTVKGKKRIRLRFTSTESQEAIEEARRLFGGSGGPNLFVTITSEVGALAVFRDQFGGFVKNLLANILAYRAVRHMIIDPNDRPFTSTDWYQTERRSLIEEVLLLASCLAATEGLIQANQSITFSPEVEEDILSCTQLNWSVFTAQANALGAAMLRETGGNRKRLDENVIRALRDGLERFVEADPGTDFGSTNQTIALVLTLAHYLARRGLIEGPREVLSQSLKAPEGIRGMPHLQRRLDKIEMPRRFARGIQIFGEFLERPRPLLTDSSDPLPTDP